MPAVNSDNALRIDLSDIVGQLVGIAVRERIEVGVGMKRPAGLIQETSHQLIIRIPVCQRFAKEVEVVA